MSEDNTLYGFEGRDTDQRRSKDRETYDIKQMWQRHHEIVNLAAKGFKQTDIAEILNISPQTVSNTLNSKLGKEKLSEIRQDRDEEARKTVEKIRVLTNKALSVYNSVLDDESGECGLKDKMKAADTVLLELSGLRVPTRIQSQSVHTMLTAAEVAELKQRGISAMREAGMIAEVDQKQIPQNSNELSNDQVA